MLNFLRKRQGAVSKSDLEKMENRIALLGSTVAKLDHVTPLQIKSVTDKIEKMHGMVNQVGTMNRQVLTYLGDVETKLETFKTIMINNGIVESEEEFEEVHDEIKGIRVRGENEKIMPGDFAKIDFEIRKKSDNSLITKEKNVPIRLGSKQLVFEDKLIGSLVRDKNKFFEHTYPKNSSEMPGETVLFKIWVNKVKTKKDQEPKIEH